MSDRIEPFEIAIPQADLDELHRRLDAARMPDELPGVGWDYGVGSAYLRDLAGYWRTGFDWRAQERRLNRIPQFTTEIDGQRVHFAHLRSSRPGAVPVLLSHGWPSTFADFAGLAGPLAEPDAPDVPAFDVVIPSLPGYGFSGPTREPGWDVTRIARAWAELMRRLGYDRYLVQGGDWGSLISPEVARVDPDHVLGVHVNALVTSVDWNSANPFEGLTPEQAAQVRAYVGAWQERSGYATVQSTRPQTLAYALLDSPLGLLAWDLEWFVDYDPARTQQVPVDRDAILTGVSITWFTGTAGSSARLYKESRAAFAPGRRTDVPTAVAVFPGDGSVRALAERSNTVVRWTEYPRGGHFAALQAPDLLLTDLREFTAELAARPAR
jgi:pimeloyl-ACP methyl ester carboxylesterase